MNKGVSFSEKLWCSSVGRGSKTRKFGFFNPFTPKSIATIKIQ